MTRYITTVLAAITIIAFMFVFSAEANARTLSNNGVVMATAINDIVYNGPMAVYDEFSKPTHVPIWPGYRVHDWTMRFTLSPFIVLFKFTGREARGIANVFWSLVAMNSRPIGPEPKHKMFKTGLYPKCKWSWAAKYSQCLKR